jgi:hypothetical protein
MSKKFGPPPDWIQSGGREESKPEQTDPLKSIVAASRAARLGDREDDALLTAYEEAQGAVTTMRVAAEIKTLLEAERHQPEPFAEIRIAPASTGDIPDLRAVRLVVLGPNGPHIPNCGNAGIALTKASALLEHLGAGSRRHRNTLVFVAPDAGKMEDLNAYLRAMLAWEGLATGAAAVRLDPRHALRAKAHGERHRDQARGLVREAFCWLLAPTQTGPEAAVEWREFRLSGNGSLAMECAEALRVAGLVCMDEVSLAEEIARARNWLGDRMQGSHLSQLFAQHLFLPRILDERILQPAIQTALSGRAPLQRGDAAGTTKRPFTSTIRLDPAHAARGDVGKAAELLTTLLSLVDADNVKVTLQIEAEIPEREIGRLPKQE